MGTHPIFESDFDCLTDNAESDEIGLFIFINVFLDDVGADNYCVGIIF